MLRQPSRLARTVPNSLVASRNIPVRALATVLPRSSRHHGSAFPRSAVLGAMVAAGSAVVAMTWSTAQAEERQGPIFNKADVEVFAVIGAPLCGKATICQRMARRFDMMALGPEDDFFTEISSHLVAARGQKLRVVLNGFPKTLDEATWFEEEICPIAGIVFVDCPPEEAIKRTQERAYKAVKGGHKLFKKETETLIAKFREQGNFFEINGSLPLEEAWSQVDAKVESALELSKRGELI